MIVLERQELAILRHVYLDFCTDLVCIFGAYVHSFGPITLFANHIRSNDSLESIPIFGATASALARLLEGRPGCFCGTSACFCMLSLPTILNIQPGLMGMGFHPYAPIRASEHVISKS